jgi:site-specific DNA-methyltransferase (adenine-specific)/adenine-specific DNA-methyltransferase
LRDSTSTESFALGISIHPHRPPAPPDVVNERTRVGLGDPGESVQGAGLPQRGYERKAVERFVEEKGDGLRPRYDKKDKLTVQIELTDFSVYYTQGAFEAAIAAMKEGKSEVMCEQGQLYKVSKSKDGIVSKDRLTKHWTDWVDYWAVDFDYMSRKEIIKVAKNMGLDSVIPANAGIQSSSTPTASDMDSRRSLPSTPIGGGNDEVVEFEERWTGGYIFENEWQSFRTRRNRDLELTTALHSYDRPGRYTVAVKVIDIFGNDTMTLVPVNVG